MDMIAYKKHLKHTARSKTSLDEMSMVGKISNFIKIVTLINDLAELKTQRLSKDDLDQKVSKILERSAKLMKKYNIDKVYKDMIQCGINSSLRNLNYKI